MSVDVVLEICILRRHIIKYNVHFKTINFVITYKLFLIRNFIQFVICSIKII